MPDFTVAPRGVDTSGRAILMSQFMADWWQAVVDRLGWEPVIIQGAWMSRVPGGGAASSAGYHDRGGCLDIRTRDLTPAQVDQLVRVLRRHGAAAWRRDQQHGGMDPHLHFVFGADADLAPGAAAQWLDYRAGGNGLTGSSAGRDYEWRPKPLVLTPPEEMFMLNDADKQWLEAIIKAEVADAVKPIVDGLRLDIGKPFKWSDDAVFTTILRRLEHIEAAVKPVKP